MSISRSLDLRRKRDRYGDDRDAAVPAKPVPPAPQTVSPPAPPATTAPAKTPAKTIVTAPPPAVYTPAASSTQIVAAPRHLRRRFNRFRLQCRRPAGREPVEAVRPAPQVGATHQAEEEPSDSPIGDWRPSKGTVRIAKCGNALCGYALSHRQREGRSDLINMKPRRNGNGPAASAAGSWRDVLRHDVDQGDQHASRRSLRARSLLCSGNNWSRITRRADSLVMWQTLSGSV
jgi:hypothetical protein